MSAWWSGARKPQHLQAAHNPAEAHARFVYVNDDGSARELDAEECAYLATAFHPADGARPYIKSRYTARTPTGHLRGFLERSELPEHIQVAAAPESLQ